MNPWIKFFLAWIAVISIVYGISMLFPGNLLKEEVKPLNNNITDNYKNGSYSIVVYNDTVTNRLEPVWIKQPNGTRLWFNPEKHRREQ